MGDENTPHEMAERDEAAAERMHKMEEVDANIARGFDSISATMTILGYEDPAENLADSAEKADHASIAAKLSAETYAGAAQSWTNVEHDLSEKAKLTGEAYGAQATAAGAHQALDGGHALTDDQRTQLELTAAREEASVPIYQERAVEMGHEAVEEAQHAQAQEASARLGDPESGVAQ